MTLPTSLTMSLEQMPRIPIKKIRENVVTLRTEYESEALGELGDSMEDKGQLQPIIVQQGEGDWYDLVIGSRRLRAAKAKGQHNVVAYMIDKRAPVELLFIALAENLHRRDLNPFEEAQGFLRLMKEFGLDLKQIAKGVNKPQNYVRGRLQLLSMPEEVVELVSEEKLPIGSVRTLARLPTGEDQVRVAREVTMHRLSQTELQTLVQKELAEPPRKERESHELTSVKLQARVSEFTTFLQKVPRRVNIRRMNVAEKQNVLKTLQQMEDEVRVLKELFKDAFAPSALGQKLHKNNPELLNHREEWTGKDIKRINAARRPSDEELAVELGRTVGAIRAMRAQTSEKVK